jgi:hypothetical protein
MQSYQSTQAHAFQPYQALLQKHVGSIGVPEFFQPPCENHIFFSASVDYGHVCK